MFQKQMQKLRQTQGIRLKSGAVKDAGISGMFAGVIAVLVLLALYVTARFASERAYREKWKDYNDCGWA